MIHLRLLSTVALGGCEERDLFRAFQLVDCAKILLAQVEYEVELGVSSESFVLESDQESCSV